MAAPTLVEAGIVLSSRMGKDAQDLLDALVSAADAIVIEFGPDHWHEAIEAWSRFGRGRQPAGLNFGDCLAYATARLADLPLLAMGDNPHDERGARLTPIQARRRATIEVRPAEGERA